MFYAQIKFCDEHDVTDNNCSVCVEAKEKVMTHVPTGKEYEFIDDYELTTLGVIEDSVIEPNEDQKLMLILNPWLSDWMQDYLALWARNA